MCRSSPETRGPWVEAGVGAPGLLFSSRFQCLWFLGRPYFRCWWALCSSRFPRFPCFLECSPKGAFVQ